jgi:hypothetical protein
MKVEFLLHDLAHRPSGKPRRLKSHSEDSLPDRLVKVRMPRPKNLE